MQLQYHAYSQDTGDHNVRHRRKNGKVEYCIQGAHLSSNLEEQVVSVSHFGSAILGEYIELEPLWIDDRRK